MSVDVVIVNYNSGKLLSQCIQCLEKQTLLPHKVIIVDNASNDDSMAGSHSSLIKIQTIYLEQNSGFTGANNVALQNIEDVPFVALLNPDAFPENDWLEKLVTTAQQNPQYGFFASNMLDANDHQIIDGQGDEYHLSGLAWRKNHGKKNHSDNQLSNECREIFAACAGAALYKLEDILAVGGFDESFFCYMEDVDLSFRLLLAGKKGLYVPTATVYHIGSAITGKKSDFSLYYGHRNLVWVFFKNLPWPLLVLLLPFHIALNLFSIIYFMYQKRTRVLLKAKYDALKGLPQVLRKRTIIQQNRVASTRYIFSLMNKKLYLVKK